MPLAISHIASAHVNRLQLALYWATSGDSTCGGVRPTPLVPHRADAALQRAGDESFLVLDSKVAA